MSTHPLDPLLHPQSIALVGASSRKDSPGYILADMVLNSRFSGKVFPVNPKYNELFGQTCYPNLNVLPEVAEHVVLAVGNDCLEQALADAIKQGAKAVTIFANGILESDVEPNLQQRLTAMADHAGVAVCGSNGMGFYSVLQNLYIGIYPLSSEIPVGGISFIAQSGSAFSALTHNGCRLKFNFCVSSGNEMVTTVADYMDWALDQKITRVIGLFLETVRDPEAFVSALEKAAAKNIPVVVLKVGKSPLGARFAHTHTGAIAGNSAVYEALFRKHGVIKVDDFNEMAATLMLFQSDQRPGPGELATIQESGGLRELVADLADDLGVDFAEISTDTKNQIQAHLEPGLKAENPLDAWGSNYDYENRFHKCMFALMQDPKVAAGIFFANFRDNYYLSEAFFRVMKKVSLETEKPVVMANCYSDLANENLCHQATEAEIPLIDGTKEALLAIKHLFEYRDSIAQRIRTKTYAQPDPGIVSKWRERLRAYPVDTLSESDAMALFGDFGIPVPRHQQINDMSSLISATDEIGYPLVLKTAEAGMDHKSERGGVVIDINGPSNLVRHYQAMSDRLGPAALVCQMVPPGVEIGLGSINDPQFGPMLMMAAGGVMIELVSDRAVALAPIANEDAGAMIASLKVDRLLSGMRGQAGVDRKKLIDVLISFSMMVTALDSDLLEIDINPVIVNKSSAVAVDGLVKLNR